MNDTVAYVVSVDPDVSKLQAALEKVGSTLDANVETASKEMQQAFANHVETLEKINKLLDPSGMRERIRMELEVIDKRKELLEAEARVRMSERYASGAAGRDLTKDIERQVLRMAASGAQGGQLAQAGSMAGEFIGGAIGGPAGAEIGKVIGEVAAKEIPKILAGPSGKLVTGFKTMSSSLNDLNGQLGPVSMGFNLIGDVMDGISEKVKSIPIVGEILGPMLDNYAAIPRILNQITGSLTAMAGVASPGQARLFQMTVEDVQGVIGERFIPVLELMRDGVRLFGDLLQNLLPSGSEVRNLLSNLRATMADLGDEMRDLVTRIGPIFKLVIRSGISALATGLNGLATAATFALRGIQPLINVLEDIGVLSPDDYRSSAGAAARQASFSGVMDYQRQLQVSAYSQPGMPTASDMPTMVSDIRTAVVTLAANLTVSNLVDGFRAVVASPESTSEGVSAGFETGASGVINALRALGVDI
jgi:hypothetical protein